MDAAVSERRREPHGTVGVRRVGCKHSIGKILARLSEKNQSPFSTCRGDRTDA
jgi:hypothetical protein